MVASDNNRVPQFESSNHKIFTFFEQYILKLFWKDKNKDKEAGIHKKIVGYSNNTTP